jgi:hypothetical protein
MSSFYEDASLVMIPSGYKTSKVYSAKPTDGAGDLTFSRSNDTATRVASNGLIEKVRTNLVSYSEQFDNAFWTKRNTTVVANSGIAPNGTTTAELVYPTTTGSNRLLEKSFSISAATPYTVTWYLKASGLNWVAVDHIDGTVGAWFNLSTGTIGTITAGNTASIENVGNGWYRCRISKTSVTTTGYQDIRLVDGDNTISVTANGTDGLLVWGAQLETGDIATDYIATTSAAVSVGPVANVPRLDYLGSSCPRLLLEPQRTNSALNSETITASTGTTVSLNNAASPDGYVSADKLVEDTSTGAHQTTFATSLGGSVDSSAYCISIFAKAAGRSRILFYDNNQDASGASTFDLSTGTVVSGGGKIENYGNGWYRCTIFPIKNYSTTSSAFIQLISTGTTTSYTGDGTSGALLWGRQLEVGAYATSYIPTLGSASTRGSDSASKSSINALIGGTSGTIFFEIKTNKTLTGATYKQFFYYTDASAAQMYMYLNGSNVLATSPTLGSIVSTITLVAETTYKIAIAYATNDFKLYINGVEGGGSTSGTPINAENILSLGSYVAASEFNEFVFSQYIHFPTRLSNDSLAALTA